MLTLGFVGWLCSFFRHRSLDLSSPVVLLGETVKSSPDALEAVKISGLCEEQLKCRPEQLEIFSETKPFKEEISLAIELANTLKNGRDGCDIQMVSCDEVPMDSENEIGRVGSRKQSAELCRQPNEFDADSDGVLQTEELEAEIGSGAEKIVFDVAGIQNIEQEVPKTTDRRFNSLISAPQQFSICCNNSGNVVEPGGSYSVQVAAGAPNITLSSLSNVAAIDSTAKAEDKEEIGLQPSRKVTFQINDFVLLLFCSGKCLLRPPDYSLVMCIHCAHSAVASKLTFYISCAQF